MTPHTLADLHEHLDRTLEALPSSHDDSRWMRGFAAGVRFARTVATQMLDDDEAGGEEKGS